MLKIENTEVLGWEHAVRGARNPMNSWDRSDSYYGCARDDYELNLGPNDYDLMTRLRNAGTDHRKYMRMITVYADLTAPLYWWKEYDTYKVGTVANSCSTMHKIAAKEFTLDDFSMDHLGDVFSETGAKDFKSPTRVEGTDLIAYGLFDSLDVFQIILDALNHYRELFLATNDKKYWWQMIQLLPTSYNQKRTVMLNYEVLANIYKSRKNHKLDEWHTFCDWIESLPYSELITGKEKEMTPKVTIMNIEKVVFNGPTTIIFWRDKTKTIVKCMEGDTYDPEKAVLLACLEHSMGGKGPAKKWLKKMTEGAPRKPDTLMEGE